MIDGFALPIAIALALGWIALALAALVAPRNATFVFRVLFPAGAVIGVLLAVNGLLAVGAEPAAMVSVLGLPELPFHFRQDALSAFFHVVLGFAGAGVSIYSAGYFRGTETAPPGQIGFLYHLFLASMAFIFLADDAYLFMVAWEGMALTSYFLITTDHRVAETRRAGFLYLLIAHLGAIAILLSFGALQENAGAYTFEAIRASPPSGVRASAAFLLALAGFGAKAGIVPLHIWLPEAHPAAPSPISALLSGVMLKTAIYGILRVTFDLLHTPVWWWGVVALTIGLVTALYGVIFAAVQTDMKRLLAYSSIENIGIIVGGIGLAILFHAYSYGGFFAALALTAALYHTLNHAMFKSLLFCVTGSVLHATKERSLGRLGGLIHRMPWVAWLGLIGTLAIAGLPPLNGFVSEWLLLQAFLFTPSLPQSFVNMLVPMATASLVLAVALAAFVMVKFYGIVFLGQPREPQLARAHDAGILERIGLIWFAAFCVLLGLAPVPVLRIIDHLNLQLIGTTIATKGGHWWLLAPVDAERSSYAPLIVLAGIVAVLLLTMRIVRRYYHGRLRRGPAWDCGFPLQTPRMQDTAEGFGQPIRQIFEPFFGMERELPAPSDAKPRYRVVLEDHFWRLLYLPIARVAEVLSRLIGGLQQGRISMYLFYSFATLIALLAFAR